MWLSFNKIEHFHICKPFLQVIQKNDWYSRFNGFLNLQMIDERSVSPWCSDSKRLSSSKQDQTALRLSLPSKCLGRVHCRGTMYLVLHTAVNGEQKTLKRPRPNDSSLSLSVDFLTVFVFEKPTGKLHTLYLTVRSRTKQSIESIYAGSTDRRQRAILCGIIFLYFLRYLIHWSLKEWFSSRIIDQ